MATGHVELGHDSDAAQPRGIDDRSDVEPAKFAVATHGRITVADGFFGDVVA